MRLEGALVLRLLLPHPKSLRWPFWVTLTVLIALSYALSLVPLVERTAGSWFDAYHGHGPVASERHVRLVVISRSFWREHFGGRTPLPHERLFAALERVARHGPAVIVVDVFTDDDAYRTARLPDLSMPVVWARPVDERSLVLGSVLGSRQDLPRHWGTPLLIPDLDDVVRRYQRYVRTSDGSLEPTLWWAAVRAFCASAAPPAARVCRADGGAAESIAFLPRHDRGRLSIDLEDIIRTDRSPAEDNALRDRVVVLGGMYDGTDRVRTSTGDVWGAEVVVDAIEADLGGSALRPLGTIPGLILKIVIGLTIGLAHHRLMPRVAAAVMLVLTGGALGATLYASLLGYWIDVTLLVIGMWIEQLYESAATAHGQIAGADPVRRADVRARRS